MMLALLLLLLLLNCVNFAISSPLSSITVFSTILKKQLSESSTNNDDETLKRLLPVLVLDVDGTLYEDSCGIEAEIKDRCHSYAFFHFNCSGKVCEDMHHTLGSTVIGLAELTDRGKALGRYETFKEYYNIVYPDLKMDALCRYSTADNGDLKLTGYGVGPTSKRVRTGLQSLSHIASLGIPIVIASNSPVFHVRRVLYRLGLSQLPIAAIMTSERSGAVMKNEAQFWTSLLQLFPPHSFLCSLVDDNAANLRLVSTLGIRPLRIKEPSHILDSCLQSFLLDKPLSFQSEDELYLKAKNQIDSACLSSAVRRDLQDKLTQRIALMLTKGFSRVVVTDIGSGLLNMLPNVLDLISSAARSAIRTHISGGSGTETSLLQGIQVEYTAWETNPALREPALSALTALGFQRDSSSESESDGGSDALVVGEVSGLKVSVRLLSHREDFMDSQRTDRLRPSLRPSFAAKDAVLLIVGACVADLWPPDLLVSRLVELSAEGGLGGALLYLPITFTGKNQIVLSGPEDGSESTARLSKDRFARVSERVLASYGNCLRARGQHFDEAQLRRALRAHGCRLSSVCEREECVSEWRISRRSHPYMWRCMTRFLTEAGTFLDPDLLGQVELEEVRQWYATIAIEEDSQGESSSDSRQVRASEQQEGDLLWLVRNVDLLAEMPSVQQAIEAVTAPPMQESGAGDGLRSHFLPSLAPSTAPFTRDWRTGSTPSAAPSSALLPLPSEEEGNGEKGEQRHSVEFLGDRKLRVVSEPVPGAQSLQPGEVLIRSHCSLVSTGTEMKVFRGDDLTDHSDSEEDQPLDLTIKGMQGRSQYPMRYGYSLVGTVIAAGVESTEMIGRRVFSFSPHSSHAVADAKDVLLIPVDLTFKDAVFLPAMETAVSLVMSARPVLGEHVAVVGQGLIGLLTAAVMQRSCFNDADSPLITALDTNPTRLAVSHWFLNTDSRIADEKLSSVRTCSTLSEAIQGQKLSREGVDVSVEVSGSIEGLQAAIDGTRRGGTVVVGSWYSPRVGKCLLLGTKFHRSALKIITSQVSFVPADLSDRWDKKRRFDLAWRMIRAIRPSRLVTLPESSSSGGVAIATKTFFSDEAGLTELFGRLDRGDIVTALITQGMNHA